MSLPATADLGALRHHLDDLARGIEELLTTGLAAASRATLEKFDVVFQKATRRRLLRLGGTLRHGREEIRRYLDDDGTFRAAASPSS